MRLYHFFLREAHKLFVKELIIFLKKVCFSFYAKIAARKHEVYMKRILLLADGVVGARFIEKVLQSSSAENKYYVVVLDKKLIPETKPNNFKFFSFDPTSYIKLSKLLKKDFVQAFVILKNKTDSQESFKNIRRQRPQLRVVLFNQWSLEIEDNYFTSLDATELLSNHLFDYIPNVPTVAQNVGLGQGEIMEVLVPFGSSFVYRHVGVIEQRDWKIAAIYRANKLILVRDDVMIHPNDLLLLIGKPPVLKSVYRAIKRELGQFPAPYGTNLYLYIDMRVNSMERIHKLVRRATFLHRKFQHKLKIRIVNPSSIDLIQTIRSYSSRNIDVMIEYDTSKNLNIITEDIKAFDIGLVVLSSKVFMRPDIKHILYNLQIPVLKLANRPLSQLKDSVILLNEGEDYEKISTTLFDISVQLGLNIELYDYLQDDNDDIRLLIEHYENLSKIFSKSIQVVELHKNPIRTLRKRKNFLYCLPFNEKILTPSYVAMFSTDSQMLFYKLNDYHQFFIPSRI